MTLTSAPVSMRNRKLLAWSVTKKRQLGGRHGQTWMVGWSFPVHEHGGVHLRALSLKLRWYQHRPGAGLREGL